MKIEITQQQLDKINTSLCCNLKSDDKISYNTFKLYDISLPSILTDDVYYNIKDYFDKYNIKNDIYFIAK